MKLVKPLRMSITTAASIITGLINLVSSRGDRHRIELKPGDIAPDFNLVGSDGRRYRLSDFQSRDAVVLAWFPRAFTPG